MRRFLSGWWRRERWENLRHEVSRSWIEFERISFTEDPKRSEEVVQESAGGDRYGVEDRSLDRAIGFQNEKKKIEKKELKDQGQGGGEVVLLGFVPRGGPGPKGPGRVQKKISPTADDPSDEGCGRGNSVAARVQGQESAAKGEKSPHEEGIEQGAKATDESEAENPDNLLGQRAGCGAGPGMRMSSAHHRFRMAKKRAIGKRHQGVGRGLPKFCGERSSNRGAKSEQPTHADHSRGAHRAPHVVSCVSRVDDEIERNGGFSNLD